jgi:hypothetical protein
VHLDGRACRVGCEFCYLAQRQGSGTDGSQPFAARVAELLGLLAYDEVAVAVSEPVELARPLLSVITDAARARGRPVTITTTLAVAAAEPSLFDGVDRVSLSVDPRKGSVRPAAVGQLARLIKARAPGLEVVLIVSLITPEFAARLVEDGLLEALVDAPAVDKVALSALKPPPVWCDRAFWLRALARLRPLLARALDRKLFLDCYVAARILGLGGCPARADLSPAPVPIRLAGGEGVGVAFRGCVYQPAPDYVTDEAAVLATRLADFSPPAECPFPIR